MKQAVSIIILGAISFVAGIRVVGHTYPRFRLTSYLMYDIAPPGITVEGETMCPNGCSSMEESGKPATFNGLSIMQLSHPTQVSRCSTLELVDYKDKYSEGSEILYDSCLSPKGKEAVQ
jgi:hypothetical protein